MRVMKALVSMLLLTYSEVLWQLDFISYKLEFRLISNLLVFRKCAYAAKSDNYKVKAGGQTSEMHGSGLRGNDY